MKNKVIVSSFHTCSVYGLENTEHDIDNIVSLDSHIDTSILGLRESVVNAMKDDWSIKYTAGRAGAHAFFTKVFDLFEPLTLIIPEKSLETYVVATQNHLDSLGIESSENIVEDYVNLQKEMFNIQLVTCPNKDPLAEIKKIGYDSIDVLDIDVDYFSAMQSECYTPMKKTIPSDLGNLTRCLKIIKKVKPKTITLSEATIDALNNPNSNTNLLLKKLENLGYERENFFLFDDDKTAKENLKKWEDFDKFYNENKQCDVESDFSSADVELGNLANQFFK